MRGTILGCGHPERSSGPAHSGMAMQRVGSPLERALPLPAAATLLARPATQPWAQPWASVHLGQLGSDAAGEWGSRHISGGRAPPWVPALLRLPPGWYGRDPWHHAPNTHTIQNHTDLLLFYFLHALKTMKSYLAHTFTGFFSAPLHPLLHHSLNIVFLVRPYTPSTWQEATNSINIYWINKETQKSMIKLQR